MTPTVKKRTRHKAPPVPPVPPTDPPRAEGYRQTLHLGLDARDLDNLDAIAARMRSHPIIGPLHSKIGREKAARYAIAHVAQHPPAETTE